MFSFVGDVVVDPFSGIGTTAQAAALTGRNSINFEVEPSYNLDARKRFSAFVLRSQLNTRSVPEPSPKRFEVLQPKIVDAAT
jgi:site-specific DNA-methyltransferase (adenine-specific)